MNSHGSDSFLAVVGNLILDNILYVAIACAGGWLAWSAYSDRREAVEAARAERPVLTAPTTLVEVPRLSECVTESARTRAGRERGFEKLGAMSASLVGRADAVFDEGGILAPKPHWTTNARFDGWTRGVPNVSDLSVPVSPLSGEGAQYHGIQLYVSADGAVVQVPSQVARKAANFDQICGGLSDVVGDVLATVLDKVRWVEAPGANKDEAAGR